MYSSLSCIFLPCISITILKCLRFTSFICNENDLFQIDQYVKCETAKCSDWLECGNLQFPGAQCDISLPATQSPLAVETLEAIMSAFLLKHDDKARRLGFLWDRDQKCGCAGGCQFFGSGDSVGEIFMSRSIRQLAKVGVNEDGKQPGFGQSILRKRSR